MIKLITSPWATTLVSALVYLGATVAFWKNPPPPVDNSAAEAAAEHQHTKGPSWDFINPEADQLISELQAEKKALAKKEQDLNDLSTRLDSERSELNLVTQTVRQLQTDFDKNVQRIGEEETVNLKKLAKVYSDMDPANAAKILSEMEDPNIIKIMVFMKDPETAAIWEAMAKSGPLQAKRAALLSDRLRLTIFHNTAGNTPAK